ncbi:hypothetical protein LPJ75_006208, partial [Coemansia sp. RSA 2598]
MYPPENSYGYGYGYEYNGGYPPQDQDSSRAAGGPYGGNPGSNQRPPPQRPGGNYSKDNNPA